MAVQIAPWKSNNDTCDTKIINNLNECITNLIIKYNLNNRNKILLVFVVCPF